MTHSIEPSGAGEVCQDAIGRGDPPPINGVPEPPISLPRNTACCRRTALAIGRRPELHDKAFSAFGTTDFQTAIGTVPYTEEKTPPNSAESRVSKSGDKDPPEPHGRESRRAIVAKARRLSRSHPFTSSDREDLEQELDIAWRSACSRFDPARGPLQAFQATVLERASAKLLQAARAQKRYCCGMKSLDGDSIGNGAHRRIDPICDRRQIQNGQSEMTSEQYATLKLDLAEALAELPERLAIVCKKLKHGSIAEVGRELGIAPSAVSSRITAVRSRWCRRRLTEFL